MPDDGPKGPKHVAFVDIIRKVCCARQHIAVFNITSQHNEKNSNEIQTPKWRCWYS
jgi:hypothetical protein